MVLLDIQEGLWSDFEAVAQRRGTPPQALMEELIRDFIERAADEELLERSERVARRAGFRIDETEEVIRRHRGPS
jgi:hypothetical protein